MINNKLNFKVKVKLGFQGSSLTFQVWNWSLGFRLDLNLRDIKFLSIGFEFKI